MLPEDLGGVDHLVVIIHPPPPAEFCVVLPVQLGKGDVLHLVGLDLLLGHLAVFAVRDGSAEGAHRALRRKLPGGLPVQLPHQSRQAPLLGDQCEGLAALHPLVVLDDPGGQAVDGAKLQPPGPGAPKGPGKPLRHVPGGGHGIGHREDPLRGHPPAEDQVPQPVEEDRGLPAPRHRQKEDGPLSGLDRRLLLGV